MKKEKSTYINQLAVSTVASAVARRKHVNIIATTNVLSDIMQERQRQINEEKFDLSKDDKYVDNELPDAALCYLTAPNRRNEVVIRNIFPFDITWWKPTPSNRKKELIKAAALVVAEIERIDRAEVLAKKRREWTDDK